MELGSSNQCYDKSVIGGFKSMTIPAKYENGVFKPLEDVTVKEGDGG